MLIEVGHNPAGLLRACLDVSKVSCDLIVMTNISMMQVCKYSGIPSEPDDSKWNPKVNFERGNVLAEAGLSRAACAQAAKGWAVQVFEEHLQGQAFSDRFSL